MERAVNFIKSNALLIAFAISLGATVSSLFLSEVADFSPCKLCWYQRALMFPIPIILGTALLLKEKRAYAYIAPLAVTGAVIAFYQSLLQWNIIKEDVLSCSLDNPCSDPEILWLGFLTIPFGSFLSFMSILALMWFARRNYGKKIDFDKKTAEVLAKILLSVVTLTIVATAIYLSSS